MSPELHAKSRSALRHAQVMPDHDYVRHQLPKPRKPRLRIPRLSDRSDLREISGERFPSVGAVIDDEDFERHTGVSMV